MTVQTAQDQRDSDSATADRIEQHVDKIMAALREPTATEALDALAAEHQLRVEEWDTSTLDESLRDKLMAFYGETDGNRIVVVPKGQDPVERLHAVRTLLTHLGVIA
jgi:hypothetical protein